MKEQTLTQVIIYTDGGAAPNPGPGGYGAVLLHGEHRRELFGGFIMTTNNRMEILAAVEALEALKRPCAVTLHSDSKYLVDAVEKNWIWGWLKRGWLLSSGDPVKNRDLWQRFLTVYRKHKVTLKWVKGHAGVTHNERCDQLATDARERKRTLEVDHGYMKTLRGEDD